MKLHLITALTALSVNVAAGFAADLPLKAPRAAPLPAAYSWTDCYVGIHAGYAFDATSDQSTVITIPTPGGPVTVNPTNSEKASGAMAGGQVGCNYQFSNVVIGSETEVWYQDLTGTSAPIPIPAPGEYNTIFFSNHIAAASSARVGYAFDRVLVYGKAGAAFATFKHYGE
jgi:outer membrane immunogenic protein